MRTPTYRGETQTMSSIDTEILTKEEKNKKSKVIATIVAGSVITVATIGLVVGVSGAAQTKVDRNVDQLSKTNPDQRNKLDETLNAISRKITSEKKANKEKYYLEQKYGKTLINSENKLGVTKEELIDGVELAGVASYLGDAEVSNVNLFV